MARRGRTEPGHSRGRLLLRGLGRGLSAALHLLAGVAFALATATVGSLAWFNLHHEQLLVVTSGSMVPTFNPGDAVAIRPIRPDQLRPGMVVTFRPVVHATEPTTHRVRAVVHKPYGDFIQTKGDANATPDANFTAVGNVQGVMVRVLPGAGRWLVFYQSPRGRALILGAPLLMLLLTQVAASVRDLRRRSRPLESSLADTGVPVAPAQNLATSDAAPEAAPTRRARRDAESAEASSQRMVAAVLLVVCASSAVIGVGIAKRTNALFTSATPVGANTLGTRLYCPDKAAYAKEVTADSPVLWYRLEETGDTTAVDSSSATKPLNGTFSGGFTGGFGAWGALRCDEKAPGVASTGVSFDGVDDYIPNSASDTIAKADPVSLEAWFRAPTTSLGGLIVGRCNQNGQRDSDRVIYLTRGGQIGFGLGDPTKGQVLLTNGRSLADGQWHYVAATAGGGTMSLYIDGSPYSSRSYANANNGQGTWQVGWDDPADLGAWTDSPGGQHFTGSIDEVAVYEKALATTRVTARWTAAHFKPATP